MGKRANKRQKTEKKERDAAAVVQPLGSQVTAASLLDDASKDDEERRLESMLFGTRYVPGPTNEENILVVSDEEGEEVGGGQELHNLMDTDVRTHIPLFSFYTDQIDSSSS